MQNRDQTLDKSESATNEHSLDKCMKGIPFKLIYPSGYNRIIGCISTVYANIYFSAKAVNVYNAVNGYGNLALKVYMTSKMT